MLRFPLLLALAATLASTSPARFLPDTSLSVRAQGFVSAGTQGLQVRLQNLSRGTASNLELRVFLTGDSADLADFAFRTDLRVKVLADGYQSVDSVRSLDSAIRRARATPLVAGCTKNCQMVLALPLTGLSLGPLESYRLDLMADRRLSNGELLGTPPTHSLSGGDWSLVGIPMDGTKESEVMERGDGPVARRIQLLANGRTLWGNAPGEPERSIPSPWKRAGLATTIDAIKIRFADSVSQKTRDSANMTLSRILVNQAGYRKRDLDSGRAWIQAVGPSALTFSVIDSLGRAVGQGTFASKSVEASGQIQARGSNWAGTRHGGDSAHSMLSPVRSGTLHQARLPASLPPGGPYRIAAGPDTSMPFRIDDRIYDGVRDAALRHFGTQRSGNRDSWMHGPSHTDDPAPGGWYDGGSHLKEAPTQSYSLAVLGFLATAFPERDADRTGANHDSMRVTDQVPDVLRELKHGADFLRESWIRAGRSAENTINTVGRLSYDYGGWLPADWSDGLPMARGGQSSRKGEVDSGAAIQAQCAAGLASFATAWKSRDPEAAKNALDLAISLYQLAKRNPNRKSNSLNYPSPLTPQGALAFAAVSLLAATRDTNYLHDLVHDTALGKPTRKDSTSYPGGWLAGTDNRRFSLGLQSGLDALALFQFHRLVLRDSARAALHGIEGARKRRLLELRTGLALARMAVGWGPTGTNDSVVELPGGDPYDQPRLYFDKCWFTTSISPGTSGWWNDQYAGSMATLLLYAEMASDLHDQGILAPSSGTADWKAQPARTAGLRVMDMLLGVNPWDLSLVYGIGAKNPNHPHHRTSNPELRNLPFPYTYQAPIGALHPGFPHPTELFVDDVVTFRSNEPSLEGAANLLAAAVLLSTEDHPTSSMLPGARLRSASPLFGARAVRKGARLTWSGVEGGLDVVVLDAAGRRIATFASTEPAGSVDLPLARTHLPLFVRMRDAHQTMVFGLPQP